MSINFCTLTNSSVDSFCGNRRALVLNKLLAKKYPQPAAGTNPRVLRDDTYPRPFDFEDRPVLNFEQPFITVQVNFQNDVGTQQIDNDNRLDFVTITNWFVDIGDFNVTVSNLTINEGFEVDSSSILIEDDGDIVLTVNISNS